MRALIRRVQVAGASAFVVRSGMEEAGAIILKIAKLDGQVLDLDRPLTPDLLTGERKFEILTREAPEALDTIRHDTAHVLAEAVQELFPGTQVTIGPNVEDGFYYDFARDEPFSLDDLEKIEKRMKEIVDRDEKITREVWDRDEAIKHFDEIGEQFEDIEHRQFGEDGFDDALDAIARVESTLGVDSLAAFTAAAPPR